MPHSITVVHHTHGRSIGAFRITVGWKILVEAAGNKRRWYRLKTYPNAILTFSVAFEATKKREKHVQAHTLLPSVTPFVQVTHLT